MLSPTPWILFFYAVVVSYLYMAMSFDCETSMNVLKATARNQDASLAGRDATERQSLVKRDRKCTASDVGSN